MATSTTARSIASNMNGRGYQTSLLEVTSSPLTSGAWAGHARNPARYDIFDGETDRVAQHNFVTLDFEGALDQRRMVIRYWDGNGTLLNQKQGAAAGIVTDASIIEARSRPEAALGRAAALAALNQVP